MSDFRFEDSRPLTETERRHLCFMLSRALIEIRLFDREGKAERAADIADAFHNVPIHLFDEMFSLNYFRLCLESYRQKYPGPGWNYLAMLDKFLEEEAARG